MTHLSSDASGARDGALSRACKAFDDGRPEVAEQIAAGVLEADPRHGWALCILGRALTRQDRVVEAATALGAAGNCALDDRSRALLAISVLELGRRLVQMGRYGDAVAILSLGAEAAPGMPDLLVQLGYAYLSSRDCVNAKVSFAQALAISPGLPDALFGLAKGHQELGESEPAAGYFREYLGHRPNDSGAWLNLGHCLLELGHLQAGYECFRRGANGDATRYGTALTSLAAAGRGRAWLRPSDAARFFGRAASGVHSPEGKSG